MVKRKTVRFGGVGAALAGLVLVLAAFASPVFAQGQHGDIWTQPGGQTEETPGGHSQEVHLACGNVDVWGDKLDHSSGTFTVYSWAPSDEKDKVAYQGTYAYTGNGSKKIGEIPQSTFQGIYGPHYKIVADQDNTKSKTFWVTCPGQMVTPTLTTTQVPQTAVVGTTLKDTAHLGGSNAAGGRINFYLYAPGDPSAIHTEWVAVHGDGDYTTPAGYLANQVGTWYWVASYTGDDAANRPVSTGPQDEPVVVTKATPAIATTTSPASPTVGDTLKDSATVSGGYHPAGAVTFTLYDSTNTAIHTETGALSGGTASTATGYPNAKAGGYYWIAVLAADVNNNEATSEHEPVTVPEPAGPNKVTPAITTTTNPSSGTVGVALNDTAHLTGGSAPKGTITFTLYKPDDTVAYQEQVTVDGNADYSTVHGFTSNVAGTWHWVASYSGDANNNAVASAKADEPVTIIAATTTNPTPTPTGAVLGEVLAATGSTNWPFDLGILLVALGAIAAAIGMGVIRVRRWES